VVYPSVRRPGGQALGAFTPRVVGLPQPAWVLPYQWDGARVIRVFDYRTDRWTEFV
jgi:hypothetical protein